MSDSAYGLWPLVVINSLVFVIFALGFAKPQSKRDWRSFGAFSAFIVALFTEMYGFTLTVYCYRVGSFETIRGSIRPGEPHLDPLHIFRNVLIGAGFWLLASSWNVLFAAQRKHRLATTCPYARVCHSQTALSSLCSAFCSNGRPSLLS